MLNSDIPKMSTNQQDKIKRIKLQSYSQHKLEQKPGFKMSMVSYRFLGKLLYSSTAGIGMFTQHSADPISTFGPTD